MRYRIHKCVDGRGVVFYIVSRRRFLFFREFLKHVGPRKMWDPRWRTRDRLLVRCSSESEARRQIDLTIKKENLHRAWEQRQRFKELSHLEVEP